MKDISQGRTHRELDLVLLIPHLQHFLYKRRRRTYLLSRQFPGSNMHSSKVTLDEFRRCIHPCGQLPSKNTGTSFTAQCSFAVSVRSSAPAPLLPPPDLRGVETNAVHSLVSGFLRPAQHCGDSPVLLIIVIRSYSRI